MLRVWASSMPQLPTVASVASVWASLVPLPLSAFESPCRVELAYDWCCHFHPGCEILDGLASLWLRVCYSAELGSKSQAGKWSLLSVYGGEEGMGKTRTQSSRESELSLSLYLFLSFCFLFLKALKSKEWWGMGMEGIMVLFLWGQIWIHCRKVLEYPFSFKDPTYQLYFIHWLNQTC